MDYTIKFQKESLKPRERLVAEGAPQLSNQELLAILLRTGNKRYSVFELAQMILRDLTSLAQLRDLSLQELQEISGIGQVKAIELQAMIELGKRIAQAQEMKSEQILSSQRLAKKMMQELGDLKQEHFIAIYLDTQNKIIAQKTIFIGSVTRSIAEPREVLYHGVRLLATSIILVHNHPSGNIQPSRQDNQVTDLMMDACQLMGIRLLDHIIVSKNHYYSYRERTHFFKD